MEMMKKIIIVATDSQNSNKVIRSSEEFLGMIILNKLSTEGGDAILFDRILNL